MRVILRSIGGLTLVLLIAAAGIYLFRGPLVGGVLRSALAGMGVENPALSVKDVSLSRLQLAEITGGAGEPSLRIVALDVTYNVFELLGARRVRTISVGPGAVGVNINDKGEMRVAGALIPLARREPAALPFDSFSLKDVSLAIAAPQGGAKGLVSGDFSSEQGGAFDLAIESDQIVVGAWSARAAKVDGAVTLAKDGGLQSRATVEGDFGTPYGEARKAVVAIDAEGRPWRAFLEQKLDQLAGMARLNISVAEIPVAASETLSALSNPGNDAGDSIGSFSATGGLIAELRGGLLSIGVADDAPLRVEADRGDIFTLAGLDGGTLYEQAGARRQIALAGSASGKALTGKATLKANSETQGSWTFAASADLADQSIAGFALGASAFSAEGSISGKQAASDLTLATLVKDGAIGSLRVKNAPFKAVLRIDADLAAKTLTAVTTDNQCISLDRADFSLDGQDSDARLTGGRLCGGERLAAASWGDNAYTEIAGDLTAQQGRYRLGKTLFEGAPPEARITARYDAAQKATSLKGTLHKGRVVLNKTIVLSDVDGSVGLDVDANGMTGEAQVGRVRLSQQAEAVQVAPVIAAGNASLADNRISFDYTGATPGGRAIGAGTGSHNIETGRGETEFKSGDLRFTLSGLQPAALAPGLLGIIGPTVGGASANLRFAWGPQPSDSASSAKLEFRELTFRGPGVAVSETRGVTGALELSSLSPLKSDGLQTLTIGMIDFNSLKLEKGVLDFTLPGDETLHVIDTEFPWFGGKLGIYDATAALTGDTANIPLKAQKVDLAQILAFVDIEGLSGEGILSGSLPLVVKEGKASIVDGELTSDGPGAIRYVGKAAEAAASANTSSAVAFSILRDLRFTSLRVTISGPLDGRIDFKCEFEGTGEVPYNKTTNRLPVRYNINIDAPLLDLLNQANLTRDVGRQIELGFEGEQ